MRNFLYTAIDPQGQHTTGTVQAHSEAEATTQLRSNKLFPTKIVEQGRGSLGAAEKKTTAKARGGNKTRGAKGGLIVVACGLILLVAGLFGQKLVNEARISEKETHMLTDALEKQGHHTEEALLKTEEERVERTEAPKKQQGE